MNVKSDPVFATTCWTQVIHASDDASPESGEALAQVCRNYWYPLYAYVRRQGFDVHMAQDLTQEFFSKLVEKKYLRLADRQRGRFRWFLLNAFKCFLANEWDRARAQKRGGGQRPLSLDDLTAEERYQLEPSGALSPDQLFDRRWALDLLAQVRQRVQAEYQESGKGQRYELLSPFLPGGHPEASQEAIGRRLNLSENAVKQEVRRLKIRFGELLRAAIAETVARPEDVDDEIRHLIDVVCRQ